MATTVRTPPALLKSLDQRARALGVSRNRFIIRALEEAVTERSRCCRKNPL
jgi:predicted HicB family RNase H-like nuclease